MLEYQNKQMAIEFGFKQRNGMRQLHINRGVILELGLTGLKAGLQKEPSWAGWAGDQAREEGLLEVVKIQLGLIIGTYQVPDIVPYAEDQRESDLNSVFKPDRIQFKKER